MPSASSNYSERRPVSLRFRTNRKPAVCAVLFSVALLLGVVTNWCVLAAADETRSTSTGNDETTHEDISESNGLQIEIVSKPSECAQTSQTGNTLKVHFTGFLENGTEFDTSRGGHNIPFMFVLGGGRTIKGWDLGLIGMCVGEKRRLVIPPHLGYGPEGFGKVIGPDQSLTFDVELIELLEIEEREEESYAFASLDLDGDGFLQRDEVREYLKKMSLHLEELAMEMETMKGQHEMVSRIMDLHDTNRDGVIDESEYYTPTSASSREEL